ncbi:MAG: hypothetical protein CJBNEKGG_04443 [Prosthecobacter sp.]|nr:hypothetical protein [Prosthecobacter sp.]
MPYGIPAVSLLGKWFLQSKWDYEPDKLDGPSHIMSPDEFEEANGIMTRVNRGTSVVVAGYGSGMQVTTRSGKVRESAGKLAAGVCRRSHAGRAL